MTIITRFAPSPTGYVHIGSLRTVLYNYLYAKKNNGKFLLRIEDTDRTRLVDGSVENMLEILASVGLIPDEGPNNPGNKGPYFQSERLDIYRKYINELLEKDKAYYCFCDSDRLNKLREEQKELGLATKYDKKCRYLSQEEIQEKLDKNIPYTVRLKVPENIEVVFEDIVKGKVKVQSKDIDEQVLLKTDGFPTYHFASVVDDYLMGITTVIRGDEWVPSTPKHILLYNAFGWKLPEFVHLPLLLSKDRKKLSKRTGDVSVESYVESGYLTESILNYISLLGWNPKTTQEFFSLEELIEIFDIKNINKSGAVFDIEKLDFFNSHYLKTLDVNYLYDKFLLYLSKYNKNLSEKISHFPDSFNIKIFNELKTKIKKFNQFEEFTNYFYDEVQTPEEKSFINEKMKIDSIEIVKKALNISLSVLKNKKSDFDSVDEVKQVFIEEIKQNDMKNGQVLWPTRFALSGEEFSVGALELIYILGNKKSIERLEKVLKSFN